MQKLWRLTSTEHSSTDSESEIDDQLTLPMTRMTTSSYAAPSSMLATSSLASSNLLSASSGSSNRSSISSTSSSGSSSGNYYSQSINVSRISCDSGFSSVASSPQPQTPPMRPTLQPANSVPNAAKSPPKINLLPNDTDKNIAPKANQSTAIAIPNSCGGAHRSTLKINQSSNTYQENSSLRNRKIATAARPQDPPPPPPPKPPPRQYHSKILASKTNKIEGKDDQFPKDINSHKLTNEEKISQELVPKPKNEKNDEPKQNNRLSFYENSDYQSNDPETLHDYTEMDHAIKCYTKEYNSFNKSKNNPVNLDTVVPSNSMVSSSSIIRRRPSCLSTSQSTPSMKHTLLKYELSSPSAKSQFSSSISSSPSSQIPYGCLSPNSNDTSPCATTPNISDSSISTLNSTKSTSISNVSSKPSSLYSPETSSTTIPSSLCFISCSSSSTCSIPSSNISSTKSSPVSSKTTCVSIGSVSSCELSRKFPLIEISKKVSDDESTEGPEAPTNRIQSTASCQGSSNSFKSSVSTRCQSTREKAVTSNNEYLVSPPSTPPPLPTSSPPPLSPKYINHFSFMPVEKLNSSIRRSSLPSATILLRENRGEYFVDSKKTFKLISFTENRSLDHSNMDSQKEQFHSCTESGDAEDISAKNNNRRTLPGLATNKMTNISGSESSVHRKVMTAENELQRAIDSLRQLTAHDLLNSKDLIYI